jgi:hypothetical protein
MYCKHTSGNADVKAPFTAEHFSPGHLRTNTRVLNAQTLHSDMHVV